MKYMLMIYDNPDTRDLFTSPEGRELMAEVEALMERLTRVRRARRRRCARRSVEHAHGAGTGGDPGRHRRAAGGGEGALRRLSHRRVRDDRSGRGDRRGVAEREVRADGGPAGHGPGRDGDVIDDVRVERLLRELAPQVLGALVRRYGSFDACEDAVQEALLAAADQWPVEGIPEHPRGWLTTVAVTPARRRGAQRRRPAPAGGGGRRGRGRRRALAGARRRAPARARRHAHAPAALLPPGAVALVADRPDPPRGGGPDDGGDRQRLPRARGDDGAAHQPGQGDDPRAGLRTAGARGARGAHACRRARPVPRLQRGLHGILGPGPAAHRAR